MDEMEKEEKKNEKDIYKIDDYDEPSDDEEDKKKKLIKYGIIGFIVLIVIVLLMALLISPKGSGSEKNTIEKNLTLTAGDKYSLNNETGEYVWSSSDNSIAIVTDGGQIEALKEGTATITLTSDNEILIYKINVDSLDESVNLTGVKLLSNTVEMSVGEELTLKANVTPDNATNKDLSWFTSNDLVATVNNGKVVAVGTGSCMVTVKTSNGNTDTCLVKVKGKEQDTSQGKIEAISFDTESIVLKKGITYTLVYEVLPSGDDGSIIWESSDEEVAKVDYGVLETLKEGTTTISAKSGKVESIVYVTVVEGDSETPDVIDDGKTVNATSITLNQESITLNVGDKYVLLSSISPDNTTNKNITWKSNDENIVSVDNFGNIEALNPGETEIEVSTENNLTAKCKVVVNNEGSYEGGSQETNPNQTISLNINSVTLRVNDTLGLTETITPNNTVANVVWESSNEEIARVTNGLVTAVSPGNATITAKIPNGEYATCTVSVSNEVIKVVKVSLNADYVTLKTNGTSQLTAKVLPTNATNKTITWSSSNTSVATVDTNGKVVGLRPGTVTITAKASNGVMARATIVVSANAAFRPLGKRLPTYKMN